MRFLCEIIKGESQAEHTERESEILRDWERWREERWRERVRRWFLSETVIFGFGHRPKSTRGILRYRYWSYLHKTISRRLQIVKSLVWRYFYFPTVFLVLMTSTRITLMFSTHFMQKIEITIWHITHLSIATTIFELTYTH